MSKTKRILFRLFFYLAFVLVILGVCVGFIRDYYTVPILMYHHIADNPHQAADTVSPETFRAQMEFLRDHDYQVIGLDVFVDGILSGKSFPHRTVVLTFDDGYEDNYRHALPVLRKLQYPATFFISPEWIGEEGFMTWKQIFSMRDAGVRFGSHGMTQAYLPEISEAQRTYEIFESRRILSRHLESVDYFCYPVGGFNEAIKELLQAAGYRGAVATNRGTDRFNKNIYEINRIRMSDRDHSALVMSAKLSGYYNLFRRMKKSE